MATAPLCGGGCALVLFLFRRLTVDASFLLARTLAVQVLLVLLVFPHTFVRFALARAWCRLRVRDPVRRGWQGRRCCFGTGCQRLPMPSLAAKLLLLRRCLCLGPTAVLARVPLLPGKAVHIPVSMLVLGRLGRANFPPTYRTSCSPHFPLALARGALRFRRRPCLGSRSRL